MVVTRLLILAIFGFSAIDSGGIENKGVGIDQFECNIDNSNFVACILVLLSLIL